MAIGKKGNYTLIYCI